MANGDITKELENDKIEVVTKWNIQVRQATKIMELTSIIDKTNIKFNDAVGQLDSTSKRLQASDGELVNTKRSLAQFLNEKKMFETKLSELSKSS